MNAMDWIWGLTTKDFSIYALFVFLWPIVFLLVEKRGLAGWGRQADNASVKKPQVWPALVRLARGVRMHRFTLKADRGPKPSLRCPVRVSNLLEMVLPMMLARARYFSGKNK